MSDDPASRPRRRFPFDWLALVLLACVVYELTQSPALGSVLICCKFGWQDALAARWLWRNDPERWRRRSLFWLYLAWGLSKIGLVAFFMALAFSRVAPRAAPPNAQQALRAFLGTFLLALIAFALSTSMTYLALFCAWRGGVRLWLDRAVHRARRVDDWPPTRLCAGQTNRLGQLVLSSFGLTAIALLIGLIALDVLADLLGRIVFFALSILAPVAIVVCRELVFRHRWAYHPRECWPQE